MDTLREALGKINIDAQVLEAAPMAERTTFRIGGPAELLVRPRSREALLALDALCRERGIVPFVLGGGSNLLVSDSGIRGLVLDMGGLCSSSVREGPRGPLLVAEAGLRTDALVDRALEGGLSGLEFAAGLPGTVGGAVFMNARCYDAEMADRLAWVEALRDGTVRRLPFDPSEWAYKRSPFQEGGAQAGAVILAAAFRMEPGEREAMGARMEELRADRRAKGHFRYPCAGSAFKNNRAFGAPSGVILDRLGFRGRRRGGAAVADYHANIFINAGGATASDMAALMDEARAAVRSATGFELEPEIVRVGEFPPEKP